MTTARRLSRLEAVSRQSAPPPAPGLAAFPARLSPREQGGLDRRLALAQPQHPDDRPDPSRLDVGRFRRPEVLCGIGEGAAA